MEALHYSVNAIFPLFVLLLLGFCLRAGGMLDEGFVDAASSLLFNVAMPVMLFYNLLHTDVRLAVDWRLMALIVVVLVAAVLLMRLIVPRFIKDPAVYGAFIQGAFRGNLLVVGLPMAQALSGSAGVAAMAMVLVIMTPLQTILSVLVLSESSASQSKKHLLKIILTTPILIGCLAGLAASLAGLTLPPLLASPLELMHDLVTPLALISLGASITLHGRRSSYRQALGAALVKTALLPAAALIIAWLLGFSGKDLALVLVVFSSPAAVSCFPMAHQMGADHKLTSLIVVFSNCLCVVTLFVFIFLLRWQGLI